MKKTFGITIIEVVIIAIFAILATVIVLYQRANITASQLDNDSKTAINAMYYNLEEVFYKKNNYYPYTIDSDTLTAMGPELFTDPNGNKVGEPNSSYRYEGINCQNNQCRAYRLTARLNKEADYIKTSRNN